MNRILHIKATQGLGWVPVDSAAKDLPIRPGHLYIFTDGTNYALGDADHPQRLLEAPFFPPTHMALIKKPDTPLPEELNTDMVWTEEQEAARRHCELCRSTCDLATCCRLCHESDCNSRQVCQFDNQ